MAKSRFKSDATEAIQRRVGPLSRQADRQEDDARIRRSLHRSRAAVRPEAIARIRKSVNVSQSVFALYLNTTASTIRQWEQGDKRPSGIAARMLQIVEKHGSRCSPEPLP